MALTLRPEEPAAGPWRIVSGSALLDLVLATAHRPDRGPVVIAIDGRGGSGKSTLAGMLHRQASSSTVIPTDDLTWNEPLFAWGHLLDEVIGPLREGRALAYRPPRWQERGRNGILTARAGLDLVIVEGTGASQREHMDMIDATIWVQADYIQAEHRGIARDVESGINGDPEAATAFWHEWMTEELRFFRDQRPWERACVVVNGTPERHLAANEVEIAPPLVRS